MDTPNLYRVTLRGMTLSYGVSYVIAKDPAEAYQKVLDFVNANGYGSSQDRELDKVELIAKATRYSHPMLYL